MLQLLARPAAVAALTSAVAGLVKAWAVAMGREAKRHRRAALDVTADLSPDPDTDVDPLSDPAIAAASRALNQSSNSVLQHALKLPWLMADVLVPLSKAVTQAVYESSSSSSNHSQVTASARLLQLLLASSLQVLFGAVRTSAFTAELAPAELLAGSASHSMTWQQYQANQVMLGGQLLAVLQPAVLQPAVQQQQQGGACCWPHLLQLHEVPVLADSVQDAQHAYVEACYGFAMDSCRSSSSSSSSSAVPGQSGATSSALPESHDHHHHVTQSCHSINAIGPAPLWSGRKREHCSITFATITHIPSLHKILSNTPKNHPAPPPTTPNIIRHKTQQLGRSIRQ
jgi:hypothetical protein